MQSACYSFRNVDESYFFIIICTYFTNYILSYAHLKIKLSHACADSEVNPQTDVFIGLYFQVLVDRLTLFGGPL